jgi:riboflavin synthase
VFSGIVVEVGRVVEAREGILVIASAVAASTAGIGGSVAVNGVCLTATSIDPDRVRFDVMPETLRTTGLGRLAPGSRVNLEPALRYGSEVGGHLVQGHVDATGTVVNVRDEGNARWLRLSVPPELVSLCAPRGSIAVDGVSLTIARLHPDGVEVSLIPHTLESTIAGDYSTGDPVNLEVDILAKYVARYLAGLEGKN